MKKKLFIFSIIAVLIVFMVVLASCGDKKNNNTDTANKYSIQYADDTGTHVIDVGVGEVYSIESIPQKTGYIFKGLFDQEEGGTQYVSKTGTSIAPFKDNGSITLYPQFEPKEYKIILDYQGAPVTGIRELMVSYDTEIPSLPIDLAIQNKNFTGWYTEKDMGGTQIADEYGILPDKKLLKDDIFDITNKNGYIYLYAGFEYEKYNVTLYIGDNPTPEKVVVEWGTDISTIQTNTKVDGKAVLSWSKYKGSSSTSNIFVGPIESDLVLYSAELAPIIQFDENGGNEVGDIVAKSGAPISLPSVSKKNYTFLGWYDANGNKFEATAMPENSISLVAKYQANLVLNENGGTEVDDITAPAGETIELPTLEREGYIFAGWYIGDQEYTDTKMPAESIELVAKYYEIKKDRFVVISETTYLYRQDHAPQILGEHIDLSYLYEKGVKNVKITEHHESYTENLGGERGKIYISFYSEPVASDATKVWECVDVHQKVGEYESYTNSTTIELTSEILHLAFWSAFDSSRVHWKNFWVEIEYPDTSVLY
ncbi:MAG: InlB B-repeat-containing protein [Clostridia bacterium]|nr:InlB B-repeat-containing protein [Clostridia bacterium]